MIKGLQKLTLLDYPGKIACTVFFGGCNFRCPFCHNASLVLSDKIKESADLSEEEFFKFLNKRRGILEGVCITGGEPTLYPRLADFIKKIKELGYLVKLDTNGYRPEVLKSLVRQNLIDYVAMDIKNSPESYKKTVGIPNLDISPILESADFLMSGEVDFEFRTTLVRELHTTEDIESIGRWISGDHKYFLQTFEDSGDLISSGYNGFTKNETEVLLNMLKRTVPNTKIR